MLVIYQAPPFLFSQINSTLYCRQYVPYFCPQLWNYLLSDVTYQQSHVVYKRSETRRTVRTTTKNGRKVAVTHTSFEALIHF